MTARTIHFIAGLPRSGSTLLCNILAQNPRFHATATSGALEVLFNIRNVWDAFVRGGNDTDRLTVFRAVMDAFHGDVTRPVIFDKSRSWLAYLEMAEALLGRPARVLVPVRDLRDVLASFEKLRRQAQADPTPTELQYPREFQTVEGRCGIWVRGDQPIGLACNRIRDAIRRGFRDRLHFVPFEDLTTRPADTLAGIYRFLDEPPFEHDFDHVEQVTTEDDAAYGMNVGLHAIRPRIEPVPPQWPALLGAAAQPYADLKLW